MVLNPALQWLNFNLDYTYAHLSITYFTATCYTCKMLNCGKENTVKLEIHGFMLLQYFYHHHFFQFTYYNVG